MPNHIKVTVLGNSYNNVRAAWREVSPTGLPEITVRWRLKQGWNPDIAFTLPAIKPEERRLGHEEFPAPF
jgi:hypothetical protein